MSLILWFQVHNTSFDRRKPPAVWTLSLWMEANLRKAGEEVKQLVWGRRWIDELKMNHAKLGESNDKNIEAENEDYNSPLTLFQI